MGNKPINRTPFRRKPWARRTKRPFRWIDANSHQRTPVGDPPCGVDYSSISCIPGFYELLNGDLDLEWMDATEATIDRLVGDLAINYEENWTTSTKPVFPIARFGLLLVEEVETLATWVPPDLFEAEDLEEYEWMWLQQVNPPVDVWQGGILNILAGNSSYHLDIRNRRKIGPKDHLVLVHTLAIPDIAVVDGHNIQFRFIWTGRAGVMTK